MPPPVPTPGTQVCHALIITADEDEELWLSSITTLKGLQRVFYYVEKYFSCATATEKPRAIKFVL